MQHTSADRYELTNTAKPLTLDNYSPYSHDHRPTFLHPERYGAKIKVLQKEIPASPTEKLPYRKPPASP